MTTSIADIAPFIPSEQAMEKSSLPDKAMALIQKSSKLSGLLAPDTLAVLEIHMRVINSYYSNLIEGNATRPHEIRAAQRGDYSVDPAKRDLQKESLGHMAVQQWLQERAPSLDDLFNPEFIQEIHHQFYHHIPESLWVIQDNADKITDRVEPGEWRKRRVEVGQHIPPEPESLPVLMERFCETFHPNRFQGDKKIIAIMAAHHRFAWIHPFLDGNGRVGRLITDAALKAVGLESYGAWCLSRGLANRNGNYKRYLAMADQPRQGDYDGRGQLTEKGLMEFCDYMLDTAIDQVDYISGLLNLTELRKRIKSYIEARNDYRVLGVTGSLKHEAAMVLYNAFISGKLERAEALQSCAMPERSARRLLSQLKDEGLLSETSSKSPLRWEIPEHAEPWYFPQLAPQM
ncbi:Fic family protein [Aurantivibrio plasticivorans]